MTTPWLVSLVLFAALLLLGYFYLQEKQRSQSQQMEIHNARSSKHHVNDFLASMSHHLRTPLNGVMGYAEYIYSSTREPMIQFTSKNHFGKQLADAALGQWLARPEQNPRRLARFIPIRL